MRENFACCVQFFCLYNKILYISILSICSCSWGYILVPLDRIDLTITFSLFPDGGVKLSEYEASAAGIITSFVERFPGEEFDACITDLWQKEKECL